MKLNKEEKISFFSLAAHQLKKPLSTMKLSLQMLLEGDFGQISKEQKDIIEKILQRDEALICLVDDLLHMAQNQKNQKDINLTLVDVEGLIESIINFEKGDIINKKIQIDFVKSNQEIPKVMLDKEKIYLAIQNIIDNAIKYTPDGGRVNVSLRVDKKNLEVKVEDSGIGIPENQKKNLFSQFFRGDNAVKTQTVGSGLGLFIAKSIVEDHKGKIWFESKENQGSKFFIKIPIRH